MSDLMAHTITVFLGFFAIMNPIANTAVFVGLTGGMDKSQQVKVAIKSLLIAFSVIVLFALLGKTIFDLFGITLPALRITGGILVFIIGYHMINGEGSKMHHAPTDTDSQDQDIAVSPLGVPLLAGPGTIATAMNYAAAGSWTETVITITAFAALALVTLVCFIFSQKIIAFVGDSGLSIVTRLMGLILAVIGVQLLIAGILGAIPAS